MSYQQDIRDVLTAAANQHRSAATFDVTVARPGSFDMKVILMNHATRYEEIFDLSNGLTPRTRKAIEEWVDAIMTDPTR